MTLYCIAGHVRFKAVTNTDLRTGGWLFLDPGTPHALDAVTDSSLLLTILFDKTDDGRGARDPGN